MFRISYPISAALRCSREGCSPCGELGRWRGGAWLGWRLEVCPPAHRPAATLSSPHLRACVAMTGAAKPRWLHATAPKLAGPFKHQDTEINSADTPFEFSEESEEKIAFTLSKCALPHTKAGATAPAPTPPGGCVRQVPGYAAGEAERDHADALDRPATAGQGAPHHPYQRGQGSG